MSSARPERIKSIRPLRARLDRHAAPVSSGAIEVGYLHVDGVRLRYARSEGTGDPILMCNGIGANFELLMPFVEALKGRRIVLFDVPGCGQSEASLFWPTLRRYANFAVGLLDALGHSGAFSVAGVSWGGGLAQQIARDYPDRVQHLILLATCPGILLVRGRLSALLLMMSPIRYFSPRFMARNASTIYGGEMQGHLGRAARYASKARPPAVHAYFQQLYAIFRFTSLPWLHKLKCPALILCGDDDPLIRPSNAYILAALLRDARLHFIRGGGHLFLDMQADETARVIEQFLVEKTPGAKR
jgi:poly(3-hydroxyalkanoate) depolymerase